MIKYKFYFLILLLAFAFVAIVFSASYVHASGPVFCGGDLCGVVASYNPGSAGESVCTISGKANFGGQTCNTWDSTTGVFDANNAMTFTKTQGSVPNSDVYGDPNYNMGFSSGMPIQVFFNPVDDNGSVAVGNASYAYNGCACGSNDVNAPGCGGQGSGSASGTANPGDGVNLTVINACKPDSNMSSATTGAWGGGAASVTISDGAVYCYSSSNTNSPWIDPNDTSLGRKNFVPDGAGGCREDCSGSISASPTSGNVCSTAVGTSYITWSTNCGDPAVYVNDNGGAYTLMSGERSSSGTENPAAWIVGGHTYDFQLRNGTSSLDDVSVGATNLTCSGCSGAYPNATCPVPSVTNVPKAIISLSPASLAFSVAQGKSPNPQTITISNTGNATLKWTGNDDTDWLILGATFGPVSGTIAAGGSQDVTVSVNSSTLAPGTHNTTITIGDTDGGASNSPQTVDVTLTVISADPIVCNPGSQKVGIGVNATLNVSGGLGGTYSWTATGGTPSSQASANTSFSTKYASAGSKSVKVEDTSGQATCIVSVNSGVCSPSDCEDNNSCTTDTCNNGTCVHDPVVAAVFQDFTNKFISGTKCRASAGVCDPPEYCDGTTVCPADKFYPEGFICAAGMSCNGSQECVPVLSCDPSSQTVTPGGNATLSASGGSGGTYSWTATGGNPSSGTGSTFNTSYASTGSKTVSLGDGSTTTTCNVNVSSTPKATLDLNGPFDFSADQGTNPSNQTLTISNTGTATLNWSGSDNASWLTLGSTSGAIGAGNSQGVTLSVISSSLAQGTYNATVTITDPNASNSPQTVAVTLTVTAPAGATSGTITCLPQSFVGGYCNCTIPAGSGSCSVSLGWSTSNPPAGSTSALTYTTSSGVTNTVNENSDPGRVFDVPYNSPFGQQIFYLNNNSSQLDSLTATTNCATGTSWNDGSKTCVSAAPVVSNITVTEPNYCVGPGITVNWTYSSSPSAASNPQSAYQIQITKSGNFVSPVPDIDTGKVSGSSQSAFVDSGAPPWLWNTTFRARVRTWDSNDIPSVWSNPSGSWNTPKHSYPLVNNFTWLPVNPTAKQPVQFTDNTQFFDSGQGQRTWNWLFGASIPTPTPTPTQIAISSCQEITQPGNYTLSKDISSSGAAGTYCINIHDVNGVNLDCLGRSITNVNDSALVVTNVNGFSVTNCSVSNGDANRLNGYFGGTISIDKSSSGSVNNNTFASVNTTTLETFSSVKDSNAINFSNNKFSSNWINVQRSTNMTMGYNMFTHANTGFYSQGGFAPSLILFMGGSNNIITNNNMDGGSDGNVGNRYGADDGVFLQNESNDTVSSNTIKNVWDAGIETGGMIKNTTINNNSMYNTGLAAIGAWLYNNWQGNTVSGNTGEKAEYLFDFFRYGELQPGEPTFNFQNNIFSNNTVINFNPSYPYSSKFDLDYNDVQYNSPSPSKPINAGNTVVSNNSFSNNNFSLVPLQPPLLKPFAAIIDGGSNVCTKGADGNYPLACGRPGGSAIKQDTSHLLADILNSVFAAVNNTSTQQNPIYTFDTGGQYNVTETATDKDNYSCSLTLPIGVGRVIPVWKEVSPN